MFIINHKPSSPFFARFDIEKYLKFKIQKSNKKWQFFKKGYPQPSGKPIKSFHSLLDRYCWIWLEDSGHPEINSYKYIQSLHSRVTGVSKNLKKSFCRSCCWWVETKRVCVCGDLKKNRNLTKGCTHWSTPGIHEARQPAPQGTTWQSVCPSRASCWWVLISVPGIYIENIFFSISAEDRCSTLEKRYWSIFTCTYIYTLVCI